MIFMNIQASACSFNQNDDWRLNNTTRTKSSDIVVADEIVAHVQFIDVKVRHNRDRGVYSVSFRGI